MASSQDYWGLREDDILLRRVDPLEDNARNSNGDLVLLGGVLRAGHLTGNGASCYVERLLRPEHSIANVASPDGTANFDHGEPGQPLVAGIKVSDIWAHRDRFEVRLSETEPEVSVIHYAHADIFYVKSPEDDELSERALNTRVGRARNAHLLPYIHPLSGNADWARYLKPHG